MCCVHSISQRGAKRLRDEMTKTGWREVVDRGLDRVFCCCTQGPGFPDAGMKDIWEDRVPGARGLCRETHGVSKHTYPGLVSVSPRMFPALLSVSSAGPASQAAHGSASPRPPAPAAPNAARTIREIKIKLSITSCSDYSRCRMRPGIYSHVIETKIIVYKIGI